MGEDIRKQTHKTHTIQHKSHRLNFVKVSETEEIFSPVCPRVQLLFAQEGPAQRRSRLTGHCLHWEGVDQARGVSVSPPLVLDTEKVKQSFEEKVLVKAALAQHDPLLSMSRESALSEMFSAKVTAGNWADHMEDFEGLAKFLSESFES